MDIYAKKGHKVIAKHLDWGYDHDAATANEHLTQNGVYTVNYTYVGDWRTDVHLEEFECVEFNSVHFEDFEENTLTS